VFVQERPLSTCITGLMSSDDDVITAKELSASDEPEANQNIG